MFFHLTLGGHKAADGPFPLRQFPEVFGLTEV